MRYPCKAFSLRTIITLDGVAKSLCTECKAHDCTNIVERRKISILGSEIEFRLLNKGDDFYIVYECEGYTEREDIDEEDEI